MTLLLTMGILGGVIRRLVKRNIGVVKEKSRCGGERGERGERGAFLLGWM